MILPKTNIEHKLCKLRDDEFELSTWEYRVYQDLYKDNIRKNNESLQNKETLSYNTFDFDQLKTQKIYHLNQIKKICIDYRLRFLDITYFKGKIPKSAISAIHTIEQQHKTTIEGFKIIAPSKMFKLENLDDPLLFAPMGNDYFYLVHKWGNDLHPMRKIAMWFFKSFENLLFLTFLVSLLLTFMVPIGLFSKQSDTTIFFITFLFMFKSIAAIVLFYGVALGKNFNTAIWNSKYFNA